jgi:endonuclease I
MGIETVAEGPTASATTTKYYQGIGASLTGKALINALHKLVDKQHEFEYDAARDKMFGAVDDLDNDNIVQDVYTGRRVPGVTDRNSAFQRGLNAEHCWPQSLGAKDGPARSDLHHLFPADAGANSQRNNLPFGEVIKGEGTMLPDFLGDGLHSRMGTGAAGQNVFEPRADHRGDVARAIFYFYVRYAVGGAKTPVPILTTNFKLEHDTLLRWAVQDPVSPKEKLRNEAIYKYQGNRNPFVDHPEYIKRIGKFISKGKDGEEWGDEP